MNGPLDSERLDAWILDSSTRDDCTLGLWTPRRMESGRLETWALDPWGQERLSIFSNTNFFLIIS